MKTILILILTLALAAGAFLSRPSEESFKAYIRDQAKEHEEKEGLLEKLFGGNKTEDFLKHCTYKDRLVYAEIEKDGKVIYTGVFSHWFGTPTTQSKTQ